MSRQLFDCTSDDDLSAAERIMRDKKVRRLPVLNKEGRLVGLLSLSDIARHADDEYAQGASNRYVSDAEVARLRPTSPNGGAIDVWHNVERLACSDIRVHDVPTRRFRWACST